MMRRIIGRFRDMFAGVYVHEQQEPAMEWQIPIPRYLSSAPSVYVEDEAGNRVHPDVKFPFVGRRVIIESSTPSRGRAILKD